MLQCNPFGKLFPEQKFAKHQQRHGDFNINHIFFRCIIKDLILYHQKYLFVRPYTEIVKQNNDNDSTKKRKRQQDSMVGTPTEEISLDDILGETEEEKGKRETSEKERTPGSSIFTFQGLVASSSDEEDFAETRSEKKSESSKKVHHSGTLNTPSTVANAKTIVTNFSRVIGNSTSSTDTGIENNDTLWSHNYMKPKLIIKLQNAEYIAISNENLL